MMKNKLIKKKLSVTALFLAVCLNYMYSQSCPEGYTYFPELPETTTILTGDSCLYNLDLDALHDVLTANSLNYDSSIEVGDQTWNEGRLTGLVADYQPNGSGGVNVQLTSLPESFGNLTELSFLYLEWNGLTSLPASFIQLTNLFSLTINNNWLSSLPSDIGNMSNLFFLDIGYNQLTSIPESICTLTNLDYLYLFNNNLTSMPDCMCSSLNLNWSNYDGGGYPYFAIGGNQLCDNVPDCIENSVNFDQTLNQFYYDSIDEAPQVCLTSDCNDPEAYNCEGSLNGDYITDIAGVIYDYSCDGTTPPGTEWTESCSEGEVCYGYYNPDAEVNNGICYYYQAPSELEVVFTVEPGSISLDWSNFEPPALANVVGYHLQRCVGTGCTPFDTELTEFIDDYEWDIDDALKYVISVNYENNLYWGFANSEALYPLGLGGCIDPEAYNCEGSLNGDYITDIAGVIYDYSCDGTTPPGTEWTESCSEGEVCYGYYNPDAEVNNGTCYYYQAPSELEVVFTVEPGSISLDWSDFDPPEFANVVGYNLQRCVGTGCTPFDTELTEFTDYFEWDIDDALKYVISVNYENNLYWGFANSEALYPCLTALGDINGDNWWNVLDVVTLANCILAGICNDTEEVAHGCSGDINGDGNWNVLDIVQLANCVLSASCDNN